MGYEIKLYVGESATWNKPDENGKLEVYFSVWAMVDVCKPSYHSNLTRLSYKNEDPDKSWYFYGADGNTPLTKDQYGDRFKPLPIADVIKALQKDTKGDDFRRYKWALDTLKSIQKNGGANAEVILFGY